MKMVVAICRDDDAHRLSDALVARNFRVTRMATSGGFLKKGNTTLMVGVEPSGVDRVLDTMRETLGQPPAPGERRAIVFVFDASRYEQI